MSSETLAGQEMPENRRGGRFGLVEVSSDLGRVLDLSHCGAMVAKRWFKRVPKMQTFALMIRHKDIRLAVHARLARRQKVRGLGVVLGLEFLDVTPDQREKIKEIIRCCRHWNVIQDEREAA